jgi:hypothetical protein
MLPLSGYLMWGGSLVLTGLAFSAGQIAHATYTAALAAPLAALASAGFVELWRIYQRGGRLAFLFPAAIGVEGIWTAILLSQRHSFLPWLLFVARTLTVTAFAGLLQPLVDKLRKHRSARARFSKPHSRRPTSASFGAPVIRWLVRVKASGQLSRWQTITGLVAGIAAVLIAPAAWAASTLDTRYDGSVQDAYAGPAVGLPANIPAPAESSGLTPSERAILRYATTHRHGARYLFATDSWTTASHYILITGASVLPMGGFSGMTPFPTLPQFQRLVSTGQVHLVLLSGGFQPTSATTAVAAIGHWVRGHCHQARPPGIPAASGQAGFPSLPTGVLYTCSPGQ